MRHVVRDYSRTVMSTISSDFDLQRLELHFDSLEAKGAAEFCEEGLVGKSERLVDLRYVGQGYELNVAAGAGMMEAFHAHRKRFGYADATRAVEVVRVRLTARSETVDLPVSEVRDGDGSQALVKSRSIFFERAWVESTVYDRAALREEIASWVRR